MSDSRRYLGLDLAGAKNQKTALAVIEFYPRERKIFVLDIHERITAHEGQSGDEAVLELIRELRDGSQRLGVNVATDLPPCVTCTRKSCPLPVRCTVPSVRWMRQIAKRAERSRSSEIRALEFTPYTQRPVELWLRYEVLADLPEWARFEIDETLGGNRAPLTARMNFLKRHLPSLEITECLPKLTVASLAKDLELNKRMVSTYRHLEQGSHSREEILEALAAKHGVFIYERDIRKLAHSLAAFDALICAYTALLADTNRCARKPAGFPAGAGWIHYPA